MTTVADVLLKRAAAEQNGTTPLFYQDEVDALLEEIKRLGGGEEKARIQATNVYRIALAALCRKSRRREPMTVKVFPRDLEYLETKSFAVDWGRDDDGALIVRYAEGPPKGAVQ